MKKSIKKVYTHAKAFRKNKLLNKRKSEYFHDLEDKYSLPTVSYEGSVKFSIISAVYGVEKYLDKFIASVVKQTISFEKIYNLFSLMMVRWMALRKYAKLGKRSFPIILFT